MMLITDGDDLNYPILYCLIKLSLFTGAFFAFLIWLFQPTIIENPGVAAYQPPPGTRLVPLPRKVVSAEIAEILPARNLAVAPQSENLSKDLAAKKSSTRVAKPKPLRTIVPPSWYREQAFAYDRQRADFRSYRSWFYAQP
jgi:hypothetical protein